MVEDSTEHSDSQASGYAHCSRVRTGDHSISSCVGGGSSVIILGWGRAVPFEAPEAACDRDIGSGCDVLG